MLIRNFVDCCSVKLVCDKNVDEGTLMHSVLIKDVNYTNSASIKGKVMLNQHDKIEIEVEDVDFLLNITNETIISMEFEILEGIEIFYLECAIVKGFILRFGDIYQNKQGELYNQ